MRETVSKTPVGSLASLRIFGSGLDFDSLSHQLGVQPSDSHRRGERGLSSIRYSEDMWSVDSPHPRTSPLDVHLKWLRQVLSPHYDFLRQLKKKYEISSYCGISVDGDSCRLEISPEALKIFVDLGVDMDLSIIFAGYSEQEPRPSTAAVEVGYDQTGSSVSFQVVGIGLDVDAISATLGLAPSATHRSGDIDVSGKPYPDDFWSILAACSGGVELDAHFRWLGTVLLPHADFLRSLGLRAELLIRCNFGTESDIGGVGISPEGLKVCTDLGIPLEFTTYLI